METFRWRSFHRPGGGGHGRGLGTRSRDRAAARDRRRPRRLPRHRGRRGGEDRGRDRRTGRRRPRLHDRRLRSRRRCAPRSTARRRISAARSSSSTARASVASRTPTRSRSRTGSASSASTSPARSSCARPRSRTCSTAAARSSTSRRTRASRRSPTARRTARRRPVSCTSRSASPTSTSSAASARTASRRAASTRRCSSEFMHMPEGVDWKAFRKVMSPLGNSTPDEIASVVLFLASDETPLHDRRGRLDRRRHHRLSWRIATMFDDAGSVWELIERRADASPDRVMLYDGDRDDDVRASTGTWSSAPLPGSHALGVGADVNVSWQLPTWTESAVLVGALCRLGAVQNPMLPIYRYREVSFIAKQTGCKLLITPSTWNKFDYGALAEQVAGEIDGMHTLVADHWNPDGDPVVAPAASRRSGRRSRCAGSSTRRARPPSRRARGTPTAPCSPARSATRRRRTSSKTTSRSSRSRSRTSAASSSACSRRCSPARPRC